MQFGYQPGRCSTRRRLVPLRPFYNKGGQSGLRQPLHLIDTKVIDAIYQSTIRLRSALSGTGINEFSGCDSPNKVINNRQFFMELEERHESLGCDPNSQNGSDTLSLLIWRYIQIDMAHIQSSLSGNALQIVSFFAKPLHI
jgi:hypothetical protein